MTTTPADGPAGRLGRVLRRLPGRRGRSAGADRAVLVLAALLFGAAFAFGLRAVPAGAPELTAWPLVVLAVVVVPLATVANGLEYAVAARIGGHRIPLGEALEISVLSSAANLLPLPGAALVRVRAMRRRGSSYRQALAVTVLVGGAWLATSLVLAGVLLSARRGGTDGVAAAAVLGAGLLGLGATAVGVGRLAPEGQARPLVAGLVGAEVLAVVVAAARYLLVLAALGLDVAVEQAVALTVAGVVASALGFVPGGLGLREALAGVIGGLVGLPVATGVLAAAVDRLVGLPVLAVLAAGVSIRAGRRPGR